MIVDFSCNSFSAGRYFFSYNIFFYFTTYLWSWTPMTGVMLHYIGHWLCLWPSQRYNFRIIYGRGKYRYIGSISPLASVCRAPYFWGKLVFKNGIFAAERRHGTVKCRCTLCLPSLNIHNCYGVYIIISCQNHALSYVSHLRNRFIVK